MKRPMLKQVKISNFKAIRSSRAVRLNPFTVLIGDNGSGKSSLIEALETLQVLIMQGPDAAMQMWRGIEHIRNKAVQPRRVRLPSGNESSSAPIEIMLRGREYLVPFNATVRLNERGNGNEIFIEREWVRAGNDEAERDDYGHVLWPHKPGRVGLVTADHSILGEYIGQYVASWQFVSFSGLEMGQPVPQTRTKTRIQLAKDGSNVAAYLLDLREKDLQTFDGLIETIRHVLPYATDIQPSLTSELERTVYLQLSERDFKVPGWLLSTGTLRLLALLALLRHPEPPSLIFIEEIENGLDPRTINLIVDEIRTAVEAGRTQVIATTHSPYFLDLVPIESLILVERVDGQPTFTRPADQKGLEQWAKRFAPGQLYTMDRLGQKARP